MQQELKLSKNTAKLHQMFGKKLYASKYSFISEICQNAVDSHRMAGVKEPVLVGIDDKFNFFVKDVGLSFKDKEDFIEKVCTILESGKAEEKTNEENCPMGMHGIGSISVSAYHFEWKYTVVTPDGRKFTCILKEVEGKGLTYDISDYTVTDEPKSVLFEVMVIGGGASQLISAMKEKLCYFKDIMFQFAPPIIAAFKDLLVLNSTFKIFQAEDFQISTLSKEKEMHISLDQYSYPIKWTMLGIPPINTEIGLKFSLSDGLVPDITRENLTYTDNYKELILNKIKKVADWFANKYNQNLPSEFTSLREAATAISAVKAIKINEKAYDIAPLLRYSSVPLKAISFKNVSDRILHRFISCTHTGKALFNQKYYINRKGNKLKREGMFYNEHGYSGLYLMDKCIPTNTMLYLKNYKTECGIFQRRKLSVKDRVSLLLLSSSAIMKKEYKENGVNIWRQPLKEFKILEDAAAKDYFVRIEDVVIPLTERVERKKANRKAKVNIEDMQGEIGVKYAERSLIRNEWNCKFVDKTIEIKDLHKLPYLFIYGQESQRQLLDNLYCLSSIGVGKTKLTNKMMPCIITERQQKHIKRLNLHNFMNIEEFFAGKHEVFKKMMTAYFINKFIKQYNDTFLNKEIIRKYISQKFAEDLDELQMYGGKFSTESFDSIEHSKFIKSVEELTNECKLYDLKIWGKFSIIKEYIDRFDFVNFFSAFLSEKTYPIIPESTKERAIIALEDVAKQRKIRMDWKNYTIFDFKKE